jgi:predicted DNA-binding antitoxin AbrB/MazE fold protein
VPRPRKLREGKVVPLYLESETYEMLQTIARREGKSVSELVREVLESWLEGEAKVKYGLQVVAPPVVEKADTSKLPPLTKMKLKDVEDTLKEVEPVIDRLAKRLPSLAEEARRLAAERRQVEEWRARGEWLEIGGRSVPAEKYYWQWRAKADGIFKLLEGALGEWESARRRFFKVVYYPWLRYLRKEVPVDVMVAYEDRIAVLLEKIDRAEPFARELRRALRPEGPRRGARARFISHSST